MDKPDIAPPLTESAAVALAHVARLLSEGYTGSITLHCQSGGVHSVERRMEDRVSDLKRKAA